MLWGGFFASGCQLEQDVGIDQLHACGGNARRTTCRVEFLVGEPNRMTVAERDVLATRGLSGVRLSCQIMCDQDMTVRAISRLAGSGRKDVGHEPTAEIQPPPEWVDKLTLLNLSSYLSAIDMI